MASVDSPSIFANTFLPEDSMTSSFSSVASDGEPWGITLLQMAGASNSHGKRDGSMARMNYTRVKVTWQPKDATNGTPMNFGPALGVLDHHNDTGVAHWTWETDTKDRIGTMSNVHVDDDSYLLFPQANIDGTMPHHPNGTVDGYDASGRVVVGKWTTVLNEDDERAFEKMREERAAFEDYKKNNPGKKTENFDFDLMPVANSGGPIPGISKYGYSIVVEGKSSSSKASKRAIEDVDMQKGPKKTEKQVGYQGSGDLMLAMVDALAAHGNA